MNIVVIIVLVVRESLFSKFPAEEWIKSYVLASLQQKPMRESVASAKN